MNLLFFRSTYATSGIYMGILIVKNLAYIKKGKYVNKLKIFREKNHTYFCSFTCMKAYIKFFNTFVGYILLASYEYLQKYCQY